MKKTNIILFGPPGIGKSTILGVLKTRGMSAIDLEDLYPNRVRFQVPSLVQHTFIGGADLNPQRKYSSAYKVLLIADQNKYNARRIIRDSQFPGKAQQKMHLMSDWTRGVKYDYVIDTSDFSPHQTVDALLSKAKEWGVTDV